MLGNCLISLHLKCHFFKSFDQLGPFTHHERMTFFILVVASLLLPTPHAHAQAAGGSSKLTVYNDEPYYVYDDGFYRFIYPASDRPLIRDLVFFNEKIRRIYEKDFAWHFDEHPTLILASDRNQIANGETTVLPRLYTIFFPGGAQNPNAFTADSWLDMLLSHETSHLYQLDQKKQLAALMKQMFGNTGLSLSGEFPLPMLDYMEYPNMYLPTFLLEGNAVLNESQFGNGGRLFNGEVRATVLALAKAGKVNSTRLMNNHLYFPFTQEKYWVGGYLEASLAEQFGIAQVNKYYGWHAFNFINPLKVDEAFYKTFGFGYETAISDFLKTWQPLFSTQKSDPSPTLFRSVFKGDFTKDGDDIRFLTTDGETLPVLHIYNIKSKTWQNRRIDLPMGRVFRNSKGRLAASSSAPIDNENIKAGLFSNGYSFDRSSEDKYIYDMSGDHILYGDANNSFLRFSLWSGSLNGKNKQNIGVTASTAIFGPDLQPYYFRQDKSQRVLYRGDQALFSYVGYWGFPVDVDASGAVYFIAPVERGASLFKWQNGQFTRMTSSDVVVDAELINDKSAFVDEVSDTGYNYKIIPLSETSEAPFEYKYSFEKSPNFNLFEQAQVNPPSSLASNAGTAKAPTEPAAAPTTQPTSATATQTATAAPTFAPPPLDPKKETKYSSWHDMSFAGLDPMLYSVSSGNSDVTIGGATMNFSDPLLNQQLSIGVAAGTDDYAQSTIDYLNSEHVLNWTALAQYTRNLYLNSPLSSNVGGGNTYGTSNGTSRYDSWLGAAGVIYPFFVRPEWTSTLSEYFVYENDNNPYPDINTRRRFTDLTQWVTQKRVTEPLGYDDYLRYGLELDHELIHNVPWSVQAAEYSGQASALWDLWHQTYLSAQYQESFTDGQIPVAELREFVDPFPISTAAIVYRLPDPNAFEEADFYDIRRESIQLKQAIDWGFYFPVFPISMRRFALLGFYNDYQGATDPHATDLQLFSETGGGVELELLLANSLPVRLSLLEYKPSDTGQMDFLATFGVTSTW